MIIVQFSQITSNFILGTKFVFNTFQYFKYCLTMAWSKQLTLESALLRVSVRSCQYSYESRGGLHQTLLIIQQTYGSRSVAQYMFRHKNTYLVICMFPHLDMMACRQLLKYKTLKNGNHRILYCLTFCTTLKTLYKIVLTMEFPKSNVYVM